MGHVHNGTPAGVLGAEGWHSPWSGANGGNRPEAVKPPGGRIVIRRSADPDGPAPIRTPSEIGAFVRGAKEGKADFLLS
ncbi:DUF397 domain-containing protein [Streptomyces sp. TRM43335]|uniref:DUF397 domain-containing protein n=1 Tax=Streptomyces taklimakanensis TaxID=2569853 RepID=A0A6G2BIX1_9ACTN|nr:DUF397 domain-containing protein [Streptomyces taklimakanensis]MTE22019.1 DUF397 domain-containing protein [Streptomyces taklimakanensis]